MKIFCDVCSKEAATIFCAADEAALCGRCDERVHHANKVASKHSRHALLHPTHQGSPLCDICQERRALVFCRDDRAIFCRECDVGIHKSNEHKQNHDRFLLTGVRVSASTSSLHQASSSSDDTVSNIDLHNNSRVNLRSRSPVKKEIQSSQEYLESSSDPMNFQGHEVNTASSVSEYFTKTLPGWRVDDFLDPHPSSFNGYCKTLDDKLPIEWRMMIPEAWRAKA